MKISELNVYGEAATVVELSHDEVELYQVKMFYYQSISGIRPFQYSMSQSTSYFYYQDKEGNGIRKLSQWMESQGNVSDMVRIIEQMVLIIQESSAYLLYPLNFLPLEEEIIVDSSNQSLDIQMIYVPISDFSEQVYRNYLINFISRLSRFFNRMNHMEGFYYFVRVLEDLKGDQEQGNDHSKMNLLSIFQVFLENFDSRKHEGSMII